MHPVLRAACLLLCLYFNTTHAQTFVASVNYNHVAVNDTFELVYSYFSAGDEIDAYNKTGFDGLRVIGGPEQRTHRSMLQEGGKKVTLSEVSVVYRLSGDNPGFFTIQPASLITKSGKEYQSKPVIIEISPAPFKKGKPLNSAATRERYSDLDDSKPFIAGFADRKIKEVTGSFVVVTGWVYLPSKVKRTNAGSIMREIETYMTQKGKAKEIYRNVPEQLDRRYYVVADTAGIKSALNRIYKKAGAEAKFNTIIREPEKWSLVEEIFLFETERKEWESAYHILGEVKKLHLEKERKWNARITLRFLESEPMDAFTAFGLENGYTLKDSTHVPAIVGDPFMESSSKYLVVLSRRVAMNVVSLYEVVHFLNSAIKGKGYRAKFMNLTVNREQ